MIECDHVNVTPRDLAGELGMTRARLVIRGTFFTLLRRFEKVIGQKQKSDSHSKACQCDTKSQFNIHS